MIIDIILVAILFGSLAISGYFMYNYLQYGNILPKKTPKVFEKDLPPHEIFPEIVDWQEGDLLKVKGFNYQVIGENANYMGLLDGQVYFKLKQDGEMHGVPINNISAFVLKNYSYSRRYSEEQEKIVVRRLKNDSYNEFLKVLKEQKDKLWEEWTPKELKG